LSILASSTNLQTCIIHSDHLADAIFSRPVQFDSLRDLRVSCPSTLASFLDRTPSILTLHWSPRNNSPHRALSPNSLPYIQEISCPINNDALLPELLAKPSIQRIGLSWKAEGPNNGVIWGWLQHTGPNVKNLAIPKVIYDFGPLNTKFPVLYKLELRLTCGMNMSDIQNLCVQWPNHPQVRLLVFAFPAHGSWFNLREQHYTIVQHVSKAFPHIKTVQFGSYFEWSMRDSRWKVEVTDRRNLKQWMASSGLLENLEDFEGTLVNIYDQKELENRALRSLLKLDELVTAL